MLVEKTRICSKEEDPVNLLIKGDNLKVLQDLLDMGWEERVDCVVIDPPYNTKMTFEHYSDKMVSSEWLEFMRERLLLLRKLMAKTGTLWVIIGDHECHYLKVMMDEVFGRNNFIADCVWKRMAGAHNHTKYISKTTDHILVYAKTKANVRIRNLERTEKMDAQYKNPDNDPRGPWKPDAITAALMGSQGDSYHSKGGKSDFVYEIIAPNGEKMLPPPGRCWRYAKSRMMEMMKSGRVTFTKNGKPVSKTFLSEVRDGKVATTIWSSEEFGTNAKAKQEILDLFEDASVFQTPKPERLIERILTMAGKKGDVVLDCFAGSGTTLAVAHKMQRAYIGVEMGDHCQTLCLERLRKVIAGEQGGVSKDVGWKGGGGVKYFHHVSSPERS